MRGAWQPHRRATAVTSDRSAPPHASLTELGLRLWQRCHRSPVVHALTVQGALGGECLDVSVDDNHHAVAQRKC